MEGERILNDLLKKKLDGLFDDTKNYIATLTRVLEPEATKNGYQYKANGCNTIEQIVSKYSTFCNKFLRCAIEAIKAVKDGKDLKNIMKIVNMIMNVLDLVLLNDDGKYHKVVPSLDEIGTKLYHIASQLITKNVFDASLDYVEYFIKYIQLAKEKSCMNELRRIAKSMASLCWRAAALLEQSCKGSPKTSVCCNVLKWRLHGVLLDAEASSEPFPSLITKATSSLLKFRLTCGSASIDIDSSLISQLTLSFDTLMCQLRQQNNKNLPEMKYIFSLFDLGLLISRLFHTLKKSEDALFMLEKLQSFISEMVKLVKSNTTERCLISRLSSCNILLTKATIQLDEVLQKTAVKSSSFEKVDKLLSEGHKSLELLISMKNASLNSSTSQTLEHMKISLQPVIFKGNKDLPNRTLHYLLLLFGVHTHMLNGEMEILRADSKHEPQYQKTVAKYVSLCNFVINIYKNQIQVGLKQNSTKESNQMMSNCLQYSKQCSNVIKLLIVNCSDELMWHGQITFSIGMEAYKHDVYDRAAELMQLGCSDMKYWCYLGNSNARLQQLQLLIKYEALRDCQRRSKLYKEAFDTSTEIIEMLLYLTQEVDLQSLDTDVQKYAQLWVQSKHELIKHSSQKDLMEFQKRTILDIIEDNSQSLQVNSMDACYLLEQELDCCKMLNSRYDTSLEQLSVTSQLISIYREENSFSLPTALLEHMKILRSNGTIDQMPLDVCQEAITFLAAIDQCQAEDHPVPVEGLQDTLAKAFFWKGILQHEDVTRQHGVNHDDMDTQELSNQVMSLEQPFIPSLHAAVDMWTSMVENCLKESRQGKVNLSKLSDPLETVGCLKTIGMLYGILKQPLNQVHANHLCALVSQATDTTDSRDTAIEAYTQSIHTLCNIHNIHHAQMVMSYCKKIEEETTLQSSSLVQLLLAKSHLLLELGQFAEGEKCLGTVLESDIMSGKTSSSQIVIQSMAYSLLAKYLQIPPTIHKLDFSQAKCLSSTGIEMTPLDAAIESITKLESIVKTLFTQRKTEDKVNASDCPVISTDTKLLLIFHKLLDCQMQCGNLMSHQGMVKQAIKYFTDGLSLSQRIALPYRVSEFVSNLSVAKIHKGDFPVAENHLLQVCCVLGPVLQPSNNITKLEDCLQEPPLINHPNTCCHVCCTDPTIQSLQIAFFITLSKYLESIQQYRQSIKALEIADQLISHASQRLQCTLDEFSSLLQLGTDRQPKQPCKSNKAGVKKKGSKTKQSSKLATGEVSLLSTIHIMHSLYLCQVFVQNAHILLGNYKVKKVLDVVKGGTDVVKTVETVTESIPFWLIPTMTHLLYMQGVAYILQALGSNDSALDSLWCSNVVETDNKNSSESTLDDTKVKRKTRGRTARKKDVLPTNEDESLVNDVEKVSKRKGRSKKSSSTHDKQTQEITSKERTGNGGFQLAIDTFTKVFDLCSCWPNPKLFSQLCQCVALCYGHSEPTKTAHYLDLSLGITLRHEAAYTTRTKIRKLLKNSKPEVPCEDVSLLANKLSSITIDESLDDSQTIIQRLQQTRKLMLFEDNPEVDTIEIPKDWTICTLVPVQLPGHPHQLIISRQRPGTRPILVKVPMPDIVHEDDATCSDQVNKAVMDLSQLFQGNIQQEFSDIMQSSLESMTISDDKDWQHARSKLDSKLKSLLERMENSWLGMWKGIVLGQHDDIHQQEALEQTTKDLVAKLARYINNSLDEEIVKMIVDSHDHLTMSQTRDVLSIVIGIDKRKLDQAVEDFQQAVSSLPTRHSGKKKSQITSDRHPVILILGKDIQHLPWENIPILRHYPVTRMPSMHFVLAQTQKGEQSVDPVNAYFVLNPENNLPNTQKIFQNWFESEMKWQGISGEKPSQDQYKSALSDHDLFLYLGHNAGQSFLGGDDVQRIICRATALLMGCSSAKLTVDGICEPRGMSLRYLLAGCPAVVGNLWDVTDRDIDRFTKFLLKSWLQSGQKWSLPQFLRNARQACKWPYLIGASPVVYGVPVFLKNE